MIDKLRIQNLRSIADSHDIELKPIMILLGANSSEKSTFLRSFPLFAQSVDKKLRGPVRHLLTMAITKPQRISMPQNKMVSHSHIRCQK